MCQKRGEAKRSDIHPRLRAETATCSDIQHHFCGFLGLATAIFFTQIQRPVSSEILHESELNLVDMLQKHPSLCS